MPPTAVIDGAEKAKAAQIAAVPANIRALLADLMLSNSTETIIVTDGDLASELGPRIQFANSVISAIWDHPEMSLAGKPISCLWKKGTHQREIARLRDAAEARQATISEVETVTPAGKVLWLEVSTTPMFGNDGALKHFVRVGRDITERKKADLYRESTQRLLASVFGVINQALAVADDAGNILMANTALTRRFGWSVFDLTGKPFTMLLGAEDGPRMLKMMRSAEALDQTRHIGAMLRVKNKAEQDGEVELTTVLQGDGKHCHVLVLRPSEAQQTKQQWDLEMAMRDALNADKDKPQLVAGKLQLVGLQDIKEAMGEKWPSIAERAYSVAERTIEKHMRSGDIFRRSADDGYLVLFANLTETEAQFKARAIADEIKARLTGVDPVLVDAQVSSVTKQVPLADHIGKSEETIVAAIERRLKTERERVRLEATDRMEQGLRNERAIVLNAINVKGEPSAISFMRLPKTLRTATDSLVALGEVKYALESETFLLAGAAERVLSSLGENASELLVAPVRLETLTRSKDALAWLNVARTLGDSCKRNIVAEIRHAPRDIAASLLEDLVMRLSPLFKSVAVELPGLDAAFIGRLPRHVRLVTLAARAVPMGADKKPTPAFAKLAQTLELHQRRLILRNPATPEQMKALAAGSATLFLREQG
jgi:PAS domain S-box-containing protein